MNEVLNEIKKQVLVCAKCDLHKTKTNYVFGEGNVTAKILFVGEAPGANEDKLGRPFVGRAGKILDELLAGANLERGDIYICNILKCRPPNNRNPLPLEIEACTPYLNKQIDFITPKVICTLGNFATAFVFKKFNMKDKVDGISKLHGKVFKFSGLFGEILIIPMYHPAVATYNPDMINVLIKDFEVLKGK